MASETYEINLSTANPRGFRTETYLAEEGWALDRLDNGVVLLTNSTTGSLVEYSPYAWQSVRTENIDLSTVDG